MRGLFTYLNKRERRYDDKDKDALICSQGIGKACYDAMRKITKRVEHSNAKEKQSGGDAEVDQDVDDDSSHSGQINTNVQKSLFTGEKKAAAADDQSDIAAEEADEPPQDLPANPVHTEPQNKFKPTVGKFAKWKEAIFKAFEQVDEDEIEFMCFQLTGPKSMNSLQFGHNPLAPQPK